MGSHRNFMRLKRPTWLQVGGPRGFKIEAQTLKNRRWICAAFLHRFFRVWASILKPLGPPTWSQVGHLGLKKLNALPLWILLNWMSFKNCVLESSELDFGAPGPRFWRVWEWFFQVLVVMSAGWKFFWGTCTLSSCQLLRMSQMPTYQKPAKKKKSITIG